MKFKLPFIIFPLVGSIFNSVGQTEISLASGFGKGMVLQRSTNTLLHGSGHPNTSLTVKMWSENWSRFHHRPSWTTNVDNLGRWQLPVDLASSDFQSKDAPWRLRLEETKNQGQIQEYSNVFIGDVIIVAGWEGQGIAAGVSTFSPTLNVMKNHKRDIRFLDLIHAANNTSSTLAAKWENWPEEASDLKHYSTLTLQLACQLAELKFSDISTSGYIGIVLTSKRAVVNSLRPGYSGTPDGFGTNYESFYNWVADEVRKAQLDRSLTLITNKLNNIVNNIPPITNYDSAVMCPGGAFDPKMPGLSPFRFTFAGAIWASSP